MSIKKLALIALIAALTSCSSTKKTPETSIQAANPKNVAEESFDEMFSVSKEEIQKSGNKPHVIYFDTNNSGLNDKAIEVLSKKVLPEAKNNKFKKVVIEAHCDERGSAAYNQKLSEKRAKAVKNYLVKNGIKNAKIKTVGYGESKPVALGHDEDSWAKNRRAVTIVIKK